VQVQCNNGTELVLAPAYRIDTAQELAQRIREKLGMNQQVKPKNKVERSKPNPVTAVAQPLSETASPQLV
jgi:hypothetical protein